jgi:hypothetical protein
LFICLRLNTRAAEHPSEGSGVGGLSETPSDELSIVTTLALPAPALNSAR